MIDQHQIGAYRDASGAVPDKSGGATHDKDGQVDPFLQYFELVFVLIGEVNAVRAAEGEDEDLGSGEDPYRRRSFGAASRCSRSTRSSCGPRPESKFHEQLE